MLKPTAAGVHVLVIGLLLFAQSLAAETGPADERCKVDLFEPDAERFSSIPNVTVKFEKTQVKVSLSQTLKDLRIERNADVMSLVYESNPELKNWADARGKDVLVPKVLLPDDYTEKINKGATIILRVDSDLKGQLAERAAQTRRKTLDITRNLQFERAEDKKAALDALDDLNARILSIEAAVDDGVVLTSRNVLRLLTEELGALETFWNAVEKDKKQLTPTQVKIIESFSEDIRIFSKGLSEVRGAAQIGERWREVVVSVTLNPDRKDVRVFYAPKALVLLACAGCEKPFKKLGGGDECLPEGNFYFWASLVDSPAKSITDRVYVEVRSDAPLGNKVELKVKGETE